MSGPAECFMFVGQLTLIQCEPWGHFADEAAKAQGQTSDFPKVLSQEMVGLGTKGRPWTLGPKYLVGILDSI